MRYFGYMSLLACLCLGLPARADTDDSGWTWALTSCPIYPSASSGTFTADTSGGFSSSGSCNFVNEGFTKYSVTASSGGTLHSSTLYGLYTGDVLIVPPTVSTEVEPIFLVEPSCPISSHALNWIFIQWAGGEKSLHDTYLLGSASYGATGVDLTGQWDISGTPYWLGRVPMAGTSCASGVINFSTPQNVDMTGTGYFTAEGNGAFKTVVGNATFFFNQYPIDPATELANKSAPGITFDAVQASNTRNVVVTTDALGTSFTVEAYLDPETGTRDTSFSDTITITSTNTPRPGILFGSVIRTGTGAGMGNIGCIADKNASDEVRVICTGQSPSNNGYPYSLTFVQRPGTAIITTSAGLYWPYSSNNGPAADAVVGSSPANLATDGSGNLYLADYGNQVIRRVTPGGIITTVAGTGGVGSTGDGGAATSATLNYPAGVAVDTSGNIFIAEQNGHVIRKVSSGGVISTVAGTRTQGHSGDGGPATSAELNAPSAVAVDSNGNLFIADSYNYAIRKVDGVTGIITEVVASGDIGYCTGLAIDSSDDLYIADTDNNLIRKLSAGVLTTVAGGGVGGDGDPATSAALASPRGVAVDSNGDIYIWACSLRKVTAATGIISTEVSNGCGWGIATDGAGTLYITDTSSVYYHGYVYKVNGGLLTTFAGKDAYSGDGGPASSATMVGVSGIVFDGSGGYYLGETWNSSVRHVDSSGIITTVAGNRVQAYSGDGGPATSASLGGANGLVLDASGNLYIADQLFYVVRKVSPGGTITTFAGSGTYGYGGDGGAATSAGLDGAINLAIAANGDVFIAGGTVIRKVSANIITTVAGNGSSGYSGDGGLATNAELSSAYGVAVDGNGDIYIADTFNHAIRKVDGTTGIITTIAGNGGGGYSGDGGPATAATLNVPTNVITDGNGTLYISDAFNYVIRRIKGGIITTIAGNGVGTGRIPDGSAAISGGLWSPASLALGGDGYLYFADGPQLRSIYVGP